MSKPRRVSQTKQLSGEDVRKLMEKEGVNNDSIVALLTKLYNEQFSVRQRFKFEAKILREATTELSVRNAQTKVYEAACMAYATYLQSIPERATVIPYRSVARNISLYYPDLRQVMVDTVCKLTYVGGEAWRNVY